MVVTIPFQRGYLAQVYSPTKSKHHHDFAFIDIDEPSGTITTPSVTNKRLKQSIINLPGVTYAN